MADFDTPQSRNEALLQNILGANNAILPPESRNEKLLQAILGVEGVEPELPPQSRIEELLYQIYLQGGVGGNGKLASVVDKSVTSIEAKDLKGAQNIGDNAFYGCNKLTSVVLPDGIKTIGSQAFRDCSKIREIVIPAGCTTIREGAFYSCSLLRTITIPEGLLLISREAFAFTALKTINSYATTPPALGQGALSSSQTKTAIIPAGTRAAYQAAWPGGIIYEERSN